MSFVGVLIAALVLLIVAACAYWRGVVTGYEAGIDETRVQLWATQHREPRARQLGDDLTVPSPNVKPLPFVPFKRGL